MTRTVGELSFGASFLREAAERRGWTVVLHPDGAFAGQLRLTDGSVRHFVRSTLDLNPSGAALVARDKELTKFFARKQGLPVVTGRTFFSDRLCAAIGSKRNATAARRYATRIGYPIIVKPNSGYAGAGISRVSRPEDFSGGIARAFATDDVVLVEEYITGLRDFRLLVLDQEVLLAYERRPFAIVGDGSSTVRELVSRFNRQAEGKATGSPDPERIERVLAERRLAWSDVPRVGRKIRLSDVANLSQGGTADEVTSIHPVVAKLAVDAAQAIGLRFCGVDMLAQNIQTARGRRYLLEVNSSPTFHQFAQLAGLTRPRLVELHDRLLSAMEKAP